MIYQYKHVLKCEKYDIIIIHDLLGEGIHYYRWLAGNNYLIKPISPPPQT